MALSAVKDQPSKGDLHARALHALGAAYLGLGQWQKAHLTWLDWPRDQALLDSESAGLLREQIEKLRAYPGIAISCGAEAEAEVPPFATRTLLPGKVFLSAGEVVSPSQCSELIGEAEALAGRGDGLGQLSAPFLTNAYVCMYVCMCAAGGRQTGIMRCQPPTSPCIGCHGL